MYVRPKEACERYKVTDQCLRVWAKQGKIKYITTNGGHRRYFIGDEKKNEEPTIKIIYSRVSSRKQQGDLERQGEYLRDKYPEHKLISDIGSGINFERKGFKRILEGVFKRNISEVVVAQRDRFTRFGYPLFEWIFKEHNSLLICDQEEGEQKDELQEDLMAIITVFTSRYYGKRNYRKKRDTVL